MIRTIRNVFMATLTFVSSICSFDCSSFAQTAELSPRFLEKATRNWEGQFRSVVSQNCDAGNPWVYQSMHIDGGPPRTDLKVITPNGTSYICRECARCFGIVCRNPTEKRSTLRNTALAQMAILIFGSH